jgi:photosystem II stability/assembly factor-like uncharacterized protein
MMSDNLLLATRKGLLTLARNGSGWSITNTAFPGVPVTAALADPRDGALFAALKHGHFGAKLHRSDDGGRTWAEIGTPAFPADAAGAPSVFQFWTIVAGGVDEPGRLWIGAIPAGLFRSDDRGASWQLARTLWDVPERARWFGGGYDDAGIHSITPDPRDARRLVVALSCGGIWISADGGATWTQRGEGLVAEYAPPDAANDLVIQDPHRIARCTAEPDVVWMQHHNGIFRSSDAGATWTRIKPQGPEGSGDDFGFAVAAHPRDGATAWFVPAMKDEMRVPRDGALAVTRTRDGGKTFETLRKGLPQRDAFDLVYRHGLDVDATGTRLAMGSTTGALWTSDDAGESWTLVNAHLPPIYSVQFL